MASALTTPAMHKVESFADIIDLPAGWNSYGARRVHQRSVDRAAAILGDIMDTNSPAPIVVPTNVGGVQLEWHQSGVDIEVTVAPSGQVFAYTLDQATGEEVEGEWDASSDAVRRLIQERLNA